MDSQIKIKYFTMNCEQIVRAFQIKNFLFYDWDKYTVPLALQNHDAVKKLGLEYDVQNNRMHGHIIVYV